jgi:hypothetical protein
VTLPITYADGNTIHGADLNAWDTAINALTNSNVPGVTVTVTSATPITLVYTSTGMQVLTGSTAQLVTLPTTSVIAGAKWAIINNSTAAVTVQSSGANTVEIIAAGTSGIFAALQATPTAAAHWECQYFGLIATSGKVIAISNSLTLAGTDGTTMTFPGSSDTVVTLGATQTLTGKTLTSPTVNTSTITGYTETVDTSMGTVTTAKTIPALSLGTVKTATLTASDTCVFTMPTATAGQSFVLLLKTPASGSGWGATFTSVKWNSSGAPTITATAARLDILTFISDGTDWYGSYSQGYTP